MWFVFSACLALAGCASIPISTALRLSTLSPRELAQVDPAQVRVRLAVPAGFAVDVPGSRLTLALEGKGGKQRGDMSLALLETTRGTRSTGLFSADMPVTTSTLRLSPEGVRQLRELQAFVLKHDPDSFEFSVHAPFSKVPANARDVTFWADLKLSNKDAYMTLIDGARIPLE